MFRITVLGIFTVALCLTDYIIEDEQALTGPALETIPGVHLLHLKHLPPDFGSFIRCEGCLILKSANSLAFSLAEDQERLWVLTSQFHHSLCDSLKSRQCVNVEANALRACCYDTPNTYSFRSELIHSRWLLLYKVCKLCSVYLHLVFLRHVGIGWQIFYLFFLKEHSVTQSLGTELTWEERGVGVFWTIAFLFVNVRDQYWEQSISAVGTGLCSRTLSDVARAQGPLLPPWWLVGWDPCGKESPCKWTSSYLPTGSSSKTQKSAEKWKNRWNYLWRLLCTFKADRVHFELMKCLSGAGLTANLWGCFVVELHWIHYIHILCPPRLFSRSVVP